jgi:hypothetical protein
MSSACTSATDVCRRIGALTGCDRRANWLGWQTAIGVLVAVVAWKVASSAGAFDDSEGCSDCGEAQFWGLVLLVGNIVGWVVGSVVGFGLARRRR